MSAKGYLFQDEREERLPYVFFVEGLTEEDDTPSDQTIEIRFDTLSGAIKTIALFYEEVETIETCLGEPEHFAAKREDAETHSARIDEQKLED